MARRFVVEKFYPITEKEVNRVYSKFTKGYSRTDTRRGGWTITVSLYEDLVKLGYTHIRITSEDCEYNISLEDIVIHGQLWTVTSHINPNVSIKKYVFPIDKTDMFNLKNPVCSQMSLF